MKIKRHLSPTKIIIFGYLLIILTGTILLCLPISSRDRIFTPVSDALFTATSATCVTGLVVFDTYTYWSLFGQLVILLMIQIGGIGFMTLIIVLVSMTRRKIGLRERFTMQESISAPQVGGIVRLAKIALSAALVFEGAGTVALSFVYCPRVGFWKGLYFSFFHSVSAFCNAGFDLNGGFSSLTDFDTDIVVNLTIILLIVIGGLGFFVWTDIATQKFKIRRYRLHTKVVLATTLALILFGTVFFFLFEANGPVLAGKTFGEKLLISLFQSVTPRTAGFNTVDLTKISDSSQFLISCLMLVGGSPGSTAGGVKTTTLVVLLLSIFAEYKRKQHIECFGRRIDGDSLRHACCVAASYILLVVCASLVISAIEPVPISSILFETISAIGTVGLSLGVTPGLSTASHLILAFLMFFGRVGGITMLLAFAKPYPSVSSQYPLEKISVG